MLRQARRFCECSALAVQMWGQESCDKAKRQDIHEYKVAREAVCDLYKLEFREDELARGGALRCAAVFLFATPSASAQSSRKDDIVFGPDGHPSGNATVTVCQFSASGSPCASLATIYSDATGSVPSQKPFQSDGIGNYHFYAPVGRYMIQISAPQILGRRLLPM